MDKLHCAVWRWKRGSRWDTVIVQSARASLVTCAVITLPLANIYPLMALKRSALGAQIDWQQVSAENQSCLSLFNGEAFKHTCFVFLSSECCMREAKDRFLCWWEFFVFAGRRSKSELSLFKLLITFYLPSFLLSLHSRLRHFPFLVVFRSKHKLMEAA